MKTFKSSNVQSEMQDKMASRLANAILKCQLKITHKFCQRTSHWSKTQQLVFLLSATLVSGGMSIAILIDCLHPPASFDAGVPSQIVSVKRLHVENHPAPITEKEFKAIQDYKLQHPDLTIHRPALYDSLQLVEEIYQSQKK